MFTQQNICSLWAYARSHDRAITQRVHNCTVPSRMWITGEKKRSMCVIHVDSWNSSSPIKWFMHTNSTFVVSSMHALFYLSSNYLTVFFPFIGVSGTSRNRFLHAYKWSDIVQLFFLVFSSQINLFIFVSLKNCFRWTTHVLHHMHTVRAQANGQTLSSNWMFDYNYIFLLIEISHRCR